VANDSNKGAAMVGIAQRSVLARYGNWYRGEDDEFAHCLILDDGRCVLLFQGSRAVTVQIEHAPERAFGRLGELIEAGLPANWPESSYGGYNFITDPEGPQASEIAVLGRPAGANGLIAYYAAPDGSEIGQLVKDIAQLDEAPVAMRPPHKPPV